GAGIGPFAYSVVSGTKESAFSYGRKQLRTSAGFTTADGVASDSDTNIYEGSKCIAGKQVHITGVSVMPMDVGTDVNDDDEVVLRRTDRDLLAAFMDFSIARIKFNGREDLDLGVPAMLPGGGGLYGRAALNAGLRSDLAGDIEDAGFVANGLPTRGNYMGFPEGLIWNDVGPDSLMTIDFVLTRDLTIYSGGDIDNKRTNDDADNDPGEVATGTRGYTFPTVIMLEAMVQLHGMVTGKRSGNI